ncbi:alpha/beta hydrolase [Xanthobacter autotrophicus]|uniref:alpha/beta hydrolase n=1 Tax=Xanthobacter TaxID=279 RepID=UPI0024AC26AB|nr:alpha/beta hydrolase [Xanthobacter autotrophicus]MDI4663832.1 alpha/beta hydrolase [Xanthobacter autotrophicus]
MAVVVSRRRWRVLACAVLLGTLAGCGGRPSGVLIPVPDDVPGTSRVNMVVATVRARDDGPDIFSGERARKPSYAEITVSIPPDSARKPGDVQWPKSVPGNPATDFVTTKLDELTQDQAIAWFRERIRRTPNRQALVFVHGYNQRFDDAVFRFAQIIHDSNAPVTPVLFTWPSRGSLLAYGYDRESTSVSRDSLERLLTFMAKDPNVGEISILAHSMGNVVTLEALRQMAIRNGRILPKIKYVMLAAPDVDVDVFATFFNEFGPDRPAFTMFVSQDDKALAVSKRVWGDVPRVGAVNPELEPYRSEFERNNINVIDLTKLKTNDALAHGKFAENPQVVQAIGARLAEGQTMTDSRVGMGEHIIKLTSDAASTVGTAAGLVIAAPVAVVDENTRAQYGHHVKHLGHSVTDTTTSGTNVVTAPVGR